ncbi:MAG: cytidine deaminase [Oscillospiraceae bacterium]|nr:cytidine deaminase [Oscillospiraceae bacterium]
MKDFLELYEIARNSVSPKRLSEFAICGSVGAALVTNKNNVYIGVCIDAACGIGFCAEHSAIAAMITAGESQILKIIAVGEDGNIMPPCGRCRELISQVNIKNSETQVMVSKNKIMTIKELLPDDFKTYCPIRYI